MCISHGRSNILSPLQIAPDRDPIEQKTSKKIEHYQIYYFDS